ncbi:hypothetical protein PG985_009662 [Apiospora marii]|uniref:uncharacterized protein n=1 Tax=Apiospora marii TaxID=335849 RepID=UPI00312EFCBD
MTSYRPLFPKVDPEGSASEPADAALAKISRRKLTTIACVHCRVKKTKAGDPACDGERPSCKRCSDKRIDCVYPDDGDAHIRTSRLAGYECLLGTLRSGSETEAKTLIHRLRHTASSTEDKSNKDKLIEYHDYVKRLQEVPEEEAVGLVTRLRSGEALGDVFRDTRRTSQTGDSSHHHDGSSPAQEAEDGASPPETNHPRSLPRRVASSGHLDAEPVVAPEEPNQLEDILYCWNRMSVSDTTRIQAAVDAFFELSGQWFMVFSKEAIMKYHRDIYVDSLDLPQAVKQAELCCLCAVAAMGMRYAHNDELAVGYSETLYHTATNYFALLYKILPLDAIKVCTLLANFNIKSKRTTALAFVEIGLSLCMKHNLSDHNFREPGMAQDTWINHRKTWRTLLFQSLLLSSSLGYVYGGGLFFDEFPVSDVALETVPMLHINVSRELTKLCLLKANISRMDFTLQGQAAASPGLLMQDLQEWYRKLPNDLYLAALIEEQAKEKRVAIYYVNLMFLSATGLLYRRTTGRFLRSVGLVARDAVQEYHVSNKSVFDNATEGVLGAQQAARIFEFLVLEDVGIWKCWLVMTESWTVNLQHAQSCLAILDRCGPADSTISQMHSQLAAIFRHAGGFTPQPRSLGHAPPASLVFLPPDYLLTLPDIIVGDAALERVRLSRSLLVRLCGPFENMDQWGMSETYMIPGDPAMIEG